jgi:hypothetical protein
VNLLEQRLLSLVRENRDPYLRWYVIDNVGKGVPVTSRYYQHFQDLRRQLVQEQCNLNRPRLTPTTKLKQPLSKTPKSLQPNPQILDKQLLMQEAEYQTLLKKQFEQFVLDQARMNEMLPGLLRELLHEEPSTVAKKLKDSDPFVRWVAIHVAARKWLPVEKQLIELFDDPYPGIRDAARQGLVRLSRGNDFGPLPTATASQIQQAQARWQRWLEMQCPRQEDSHNR